MTQRIMLLVLLVFLLCTIIQEITSICTADCGFQNITYEQKNSYHSRTDSEMKVVQSRENTLDLQNASKNIIVRETRDTGVDISSYLNGIKIGHHQSLKDMILEYIRTFCNSDMYHKHIELYRSLCNRNPYPFSGLNTPWSRCLRKYRQLYDNSLPLTPSIYNFSQTYSLKIFHQEEVVAECLSLFTQNDLCIKRKYMTLCFGGMVVFFHDEKCTRPSHEDKYFEILLTKANLMSDYTCFWYICKGYLRVIEKKVKSTFVLIFKLTIPRHRINCNYLLFGNGEIMWKGKYAITKNIYFPCCFQNYEFIWSGQNMELGKSMLWDYLPLSCRAEETMLFILVLAIGVSGTFGNLLVLVVMMTDKHKEVSSILRTSLAFSDFLTSFFVVLPGVYYHLLPMSDYMNFKENYIVGQIEENKKIEYSKTFEYFVTITSGFRFFQGTVFGVCSLVSLFTVFLLSIERYISTDQPFNYQNYFTIFSRVKVTLILMWTAAVMVTLLFMFDGRDSLQVMWSNMFKLPIAISQFKYTYKLRWICNSLFIILGILCISTAVISFISVVRFNLQEAKKLAEWKRLNMRINTRSTGPYREENRKIMVTLSILSVLFLISTLMRGILQIISHINIVISKSNLLDYMSWWLVLASSAWNPWIYNMQSQEFRTKSAQTLLKMMPKRFHKKNQLLKQISGKSTNYAEIKMLQKLNLVDGEDACSTSV